MPAHLREPHVTGLSSPCGSGESRDSRAFGVAAFAAPTRLTVSVAEVLVAGLAVGADLAQHVADPGAGHRRTRECRVQAGAQVGGMGGEALVLAQVAEGRLDVA